MIESDKSRAPFPEPLQRGGEEIVVSVFCATFNHAPYIAEALEGIITQQTGFPFEVIVHDDASTDGTAQIVSDYAARYPSLIRAVLQEENQYSKGGFKPSWYATCAVGRYVAFCEGDDAWTDICKLQTQVDALDSNKSIDICFHPAKLFVSQRDTNQLYGTHGNTRRIFSPQHMIRGTVVPTASIMVATKRIQTLPEWFFSDAPVGDYYLRVIASAHNGAMYIPETMCAYRAHNPGSWSDSIRNCPQKFLQNNARHLDVCDALDAHLDYRYSSEIIQFRNRLLIGRIVILLRTGDIRGLAYDGARLCSRPFSLIKTMFRLVIQVGRKPVQAWKTISRNFSYSWTNKADSNEKASPPE